MIKRVPAVNQVEGLRRKQSSQILSDPLHQRGVLRVPFPLQHFPILIRQGIHSGKLKPPRYLPEPQYRRRAATHVQRTQPRPESLP